MYDPAKVVFGIRGIYRIENIANGKFYIGSAKCIRKRFNDHLSKLRRNKHPNQYLQHVVNKHGTAVLRAVLVERVDKLTNLVLVEQGYLDKSYDDQTLCYNICPTAGSALGRSHSEDTKRKMSQAHMGKVVSQETCKKISEAKKKQTHLHFKSGKGNPQWGIGKDHHMYGRKHTEESKRKMSLSSKGVPNRKLAKKVSQYDLNGNVIKTYESASEASRQTKISGIRSCALGNRKSAGGFMWSYDVNKSKIQPYVYSQKRKNVTLLQVSCDTGETINTFSSTIEAEKRTGTSRTNISACCHGNRKTAGGFVWRYASS